MKNLITFIMALFFLSCGTGKNIGEAQENNAITGNPNVGYFENTVMCYTKNNTWEKKVLSQSSATYLDKKNHLGFTTAHSVSFTGQLIDVFFSGEKITTEVIEIQKDPDFALLRFSKLPKNVSNLVTQKETPIGEKVFLFGYEAYNFKKKPVHVLADNGLHLFLEFGAQPGMSGGLAANSKGEVLGIITGTKPDEGDISQILKIEIIKKQMNRYIESRRFYRLKRP